MHLVVSVVGFLIIDYALWKVNVEVRIGGIVWLTPEGTGFQL